MISGCRERFIRQSGRAPDCLYLGNREIRLLRGWLAENGLNPAPGHPVSYVDGRAAILGMRLFHVSDDRGHIRCA